MTSKADGIQPQLKYWKDQGQHSHRALRLLSNCLQLNSNTMLPPITVLVKG